VIDVVAVGLLDGTIVIYNIRQDEKLFTFRQEGRVASIAFRTDDHPIMATANATGDIALWDLDQHRLVHLMNDAHDRSISSIQFLANQPILVTSGADNSVKVRV
jgi:U3 small nucleolar RNA-associated protein 21